MKTAPPRDPGCSDLAPAGADGQQISGWGRFPSVSARLLAPRSVPEVGRHLQSGSAGFRGICRGLGRSYGDSSLADSVMLMHHLDNFIDFDQVTGILRCCSGVSLSAILHNFSPRGWFLPVVPGTRFVTVGGAIASDVHGKNHHVDGSFSQHVLSLRLMLASGEIIECSQRDNAAIFHASCGGMGLTGVILEATLQLLPVRSAFIEQRSCRSHNLKESMQLIEEHDQARYSVAWLDCMARGDKLGRSLLFLGEHCADNEVQAPGTLQLKVPFTTPAMLLNRHSMSLFNQVYYRAAGRKKAASRIHYQSYFFPLDSITGWNRLYGKNGFLQYQFVLPAETAYEGIREVLDRITAAGKGSFLSVLKKFGAANNNPLSFPTAGYTLTLDFKFEADLLPLLELLDRIVLHHGGRLYLAKDARMSREVFRQSYPRWEEFAALREELGATTVFNSLQSRRLGL